MPLTLQFGRDQRDNDAVTEVAKELGVELATMPNERNFHPILSGDWREISGVIAIGAEQVKRSLALQWAAG